MIPQACFEMGQIYRRRKETDKAKKWFKEARGYTGYLTESLIIYRVDYALSEM